MTMKLFITGTDTNVGKTFVSVKLLHHFNQQGFSTVGLKPIATGCMNDGQQLVNDDAMQLREAASIKLNYDLVNPFAYQPAIAPHIAAGNQLSVQQLNEKCHFALHYPSDICLIEGVGGWKVPLNQKETMADFVRVNQFNTLLIVGMRLGCLNHAILTAQSILHDGVNLIGWIANCIDVEMENQDENIETLKTWLPRPCLGIVKNDHSGSFNFWPRKSSNLKSFAFSNNFSDSDDEIGLLK